jgi:hypothetical protein
VAAPSRPRRQQPGALLFTATARSAIVGIPLDHRRCTCNQPLVASGSQGAGMTIKITPNDKGNPPGKLAEAELHFSDGPFEGLKLIGFSIWERRGGSGRNVTFPARSYAVNGERRTYALLRPIVDSTGQEKLRQQILDAFQEFEERAAMAS